MIYNNECTGCKQNFDTVIKHNQLCQQCAKKARKTRTKKIVAGINRLVVGGHATWEDVLAEEAELIELVKQAT